MMDFEMNMLENLPVLPKNILSKETSSHSREGINSDSGNFLYVQPNGEAVLFDAYGPGCVNSMFATSISQDIIVNFYFDGQEHPRYSMPITDFFSGEHPHFPTPMTSYKKLGYYLGDDSKAGNCFIKIPFEKSLRITTGEKADFFYHIFWEQYPHGQSVPAFPDRQSLEVAKCLWEGKDKNKSVPRSIGCFELAPMQPVVFLSSDTSGCIASLTLEGGCVESLLKDVWICIRWDGAAYDSVHTPLGYFFAVPETPENFETPVISVRLLEAGRIRLECRWPMPWWEKAIFSLLNRGDMPIPDVEIFVETTHNAFSSQDSGYFTTQYRAGQTIYGKDWLLMQDRGWGKYVGTVQRMIGEQYCEGDEHFYIDHSCTPQINGTGTEDYFLFCYWPSPKHFTPFSGSTTDVYQKGGKRLENSYRFPSAYYRFHLDGPIAFYSAMDARIQHGGMSDIHSSYSTLAFSYLQKRPILQHSDVLNPAYAHSATVHDYRTEDAVETTVESSFIGNDIDIRECLSGHEQAAGEICFTVSIDAKNAGVMLRRRIDQGLGRQKAEVFVEEQFAGIWYDANINTTHRWHDSDFLLPPDLCRGKCIIHVRLAVMPCEGCKFTAYRYTAYSFVPQSQ